MKNTNIFETTHNFLKKHFKKIENFDIINTKLNNQDLTNLKIDFDKNPSNSVIFYKFFLLSNIQKIINSYINKSLYLFDIKLRLLLEQLKSSHILWSYNIEIQDEIQKLNNKYYSYGNRTSDKLSSEYFTKFYDIHKRPNIYKFTHDNMYSYRNYIVQLPVKSKQSVIYELWIRLYSVGPNEKIFQLNVPLQYDKHKLYLNFENISFNLK